MKAAPYITFQVCCVHENIIQAKVCHDSEPNKINILKSNHIGEASVKLDIPSLMLTKFGT
jgi:hypothetical protein